MSNNDAENKEDDNLIKKIAIRNYRIFRKFDLDLSAGMNILVGCNDTGKSTLIEAINLVLTRRVHGRLFEQELSPYFINKEATLEYVEGLRSDSGNTPSPPTVIIELFLDDIDEAEILRGTNNLYGENTCGIRLQAKLSSDFHEEYKSFIDSPDSVQLVPTEYYSVELLGFSGNRISVRSMPITVSVIDPTTIRLQSGVDYHLQQIIRTQLDPKERVELSRQYRSLREEFSDKDSVKAINERLKLEDNMLTDRELSLSIDISQRYTWENNLVTHLDDLPFQFIGKGDQNTLKTLLAIGRKVDDTHVILIEEPENHLSFASLRKLLSRIEDRCSDKQVIIATHSNYVLNKLGLHNLVLLGSGSSTRVIDIPSATVDYFKKLPGFDTLRIVLAEGAILVEGPSDELVVQRAYRDVKGKLPIEDGIDVISVGLSHKRFLDLAIRLNRRVWVLTDNDGKTLGEVRERFSEYLDSSVVSLHVCNDPTLNTLEPTIVAVNDLATMNSVLNKDYGSKDEVLKAMTDDKTGSAMAIFESETRITMPEYIQDVVSDG